MKHADRILMFALVAAFGVQGATLTSSPFVLDTTHRRTVGSPMTVPYSPLWVDGASDGATVTLEKVYYVGMEQVSTSTVVAATSVAGTVAIAAEAESPAAMRLVMRVEQDGATLGLFARDLAFGVTAASARAFDVDSRANTLQLAVDAEPASLPLAYDVAWMAGVVSQRLDVVTRTYARRGHAETVTTNSIVSLDGSGVYDWNRWRVDGYRTLLLTALDAGGAPLGEPLTASFGVVLPVGTALLFR